MSDVIHSKLFRRNLSVMETDGMTMLLKKRFRPRFLNIATNRSLFESKDANSCDKNKTNCGFVDIHSTENYYFLTFCYYELHIHKWYHYSFNPSWNLDIYMYISNLSRNNRWTIHFLFFYISTLWFTYKKKRESDFFYSFFIVIIH